MLAYADALQRLLAAAPRLAVERCALDAARGRILGETLRSPCDLPPFDHAAMDGYALRAGAGLPIGSTHKVTGSLAAGVPAQSLDAADACEIMTGARLPTQADAVIAVEAVRTVTSDAVGQPSRIALGQPLATGRNVRHAGADLVAGAEVAAPGTVITPGLTMLLAALGMACVPVVRPPRIALIATGSELQDRLDVPLQADRIYASNAPYLSTALRALGACIVHGETVTDSQSDYLAAMQRGCTAGADLLISTGAVSAGRYDFVPDALRAAGATMLFRKVAMRPGKPLLAAQLGAGRGPMLMALPGTPMAVAVGLRFFITPLLRRMAGQAAESHRRAVLDTPYPRTPGLRHFLHARLHQDAEGRVHVRPSDAQQPFRMAPFAHANAWAILPEGDAPLPAGSMIDVATLHADSS